MGPNEIEPVGMKKQITLQQKNIFIAYAPNPFNELRLSDAKSTRPLLARLLLKY